MFMYYGIFVIDRQHLMLYFLKEKTFCIYNGHLEIIPNNYFSISCDFQELRQYIIQWSYSQYPMSESLEILGIDIYNWGNQIFPTFMLALLSLYLYWFICVIKTRRSTNECLLILWTKQSFISLIKILPTTMIEFLVFMIFSSTMVNL